MEDHLIQDLATGIRSKQEAIILAQKAKLQKTEFIKAHCVRWFQELGEELEVGVKALNAALAGSPSADPPIAFERAGNLIHVGKEEFPSSDAHAKLNIDGLCIDLTVKYSTPEKTVRSEQFQWHFDVDEDNNLIAQRKQGLPQQKFRTPVVAAETLMKATFTV